MFYTTHDGRATYNLNTGVVSETSGTITASIEDAGNGWYRCILSTTLTTHNEVRIIAVNGTGWADRNIAGNGTDGLLIYGAMLESGNYVSSYIPTYGSAVSRSAELLSASGLSTNVLDGQDVTILYEFDYNAIGREGSTTCYRIYSGSSQLGIKGRSSSSRSMEVFSSGDFSGSIVFNNYGNASIIKVALRVSNDVVELFFNGSKDSETIDASGVSSFDWSQIQVQGSNSINTSNSKIIAFNSALTDAECITLTTL